MPIYEPGLNDMVAANTRAGRLKFTTELAGAVGTADAVFIAVGTPSRRGDGFADLSFVHDASREIARALDGFTVVITKSTVPVGTGDEVERIIRETRPDAECAVVSNPEFLREGAAIQDFKHPDRIVIGSADTRAREVMSELYRPLYLNRSPIMFTDRRTAELIKMGIGTAYPTEETLTEFHQSNFGGSDGGNNCAVCHKGRSVTLACNSMEYQRHLDHGDEPNACAVPP
jgi:UDPglucose 6-dehydrogenase